ncbi:MbtH family NRPS accessory protein [Streptomyces olivaceiscleroticus]|uniref:MbtH-like domain-containing protein n=1 Tax=Streptomyces olivaceiscleroticus TaxID=68245 RepID=A0ABN0ZY06_9ACTN
MTQQAGPFDAGPEKDEAGDTHLVLANDHGRQSLWPVWRAVPPGWTTRFGPAPHDACVRHVATHTA